MFCRCVLFPAYKQVVLFLPKIQVIQFSIFIFFSFFYKTKTHSICKAFVCRKNLILYMLNQALELISSHTDTLHLWDVCHITFQHCLLYYLTVKLLFCYFVNSLGNCILYLDLNKQWANSYVYNVWADAADNSLVQLPYLQQD